MALQRIVLGSVVVLAVAIASAADSSSKPELKAVAIQLQSTFEKSTPAVKLEFDDQASSLEITYLPQTFKVHGVAKSGAVSEKVYDEVGPAIKGSCSGFMFSRKVN